MAHRLRRKLDNAVALMGTSMESIKLSL